MYSQTTEGILIQVRTAYLEDQSTPEDQHFVWAYHVHIENQSGKTVQLVSRYWHITNGIGQIQEVTGPGVIGEQPVLKPGESFEYTSGTPLNTDSGIMSGRYQMIREDGERFEVDIPAFSLDIPNKPNALN